MCEHCHRLHRINSPCPMRVAEAILAYPQALEQLTEADKNWMLANKVNVLEILEDNLSGRMVSSGWRDGVEKLVCDRCGATCTDTPSIEFAKKEADAWARLCREDGVEPRGLIGCPRIPCEGELILKE